MSGNTFGTLFKLTTFGESHGTGLGGVIDGCPAKIALTEEIIQKSLDERKPGGAPTSTARKEKDQVQLLSGVFEGLTTGTAIGFYIANRDHHSKDYDKLRHVFRPGHADISYEAKYGIRDHRGGGRASGRETACRVAGGAVAEQFLQSYGVQVHAYTTQLGTIKAQPKDISQVRSRPYFAADPDVVSQWDELVNTVKADGDSLGGIVEVTVTGPPAGLGEPVFDKLDARLAYAVMSVGAVKGVEIGSGFAAASSLGSANNDPILPPEYPDGPADPKCPARFASNNAGGILGGISSGQDIVLRAAVKPIPSIAKMQKTINHAGDPVELSTGGRHDRSAIPRIVPVIRAMTLLTLADMILLQKRFHL